MLWIIDKKKKDRRHLSSTARWLLSSSSRAGPEEEAVLGFALLAWPQHHLPVSLVMSIQTALTVSTHLTAVTPMQR